MKEVNNLNNFEFLICQYINTINWQNIYDIFVYEKALFKNFLY